ncbi:TPA: transporter suffix domain-containing protein [Bacillus cereus]|uniref:transporter suffix domain-containing protein n=1 Tax=Bacillus TaxID=1386 RepID=UPI0008640C2D|nr:MULTISPECIES: transporter suffix domain-containing protein [Bacillus]MCP1177187.1 transporter suffix domain-containing protein [Bacillus sp. 1663tsa1]MCP1284448.1 transporter suffix domain-containing protein [Bacillus sp. S0635]MCQ6348050.1 transporter suffix domain-containing protein [Bacillus cereus]MCU5458937.1 transporter suffix domain-containing protein [Bacillus cereus]MCU5748346.1 transporter suffix domain-containing protein [Bacillus cereus]
MEEEIISNENKQKKPLLFKVGIGLLVIYVLLWASALIIPFTSLSTQIKAIVIPGCIVIGEILFLIGAVFVGKEVVAKYKKYLNPKNWRRKGERDKYEK